MGRGGRLLLRPLAASGRQLHAAQGALDGGASAPLRNDGHRKTTAREPAGGDDFIRSARATDARAVQIHPFHRSGSFRCGRAWDYGPGQPGTAAPGPFENAR